ncbi:hypothetical protein IW152_003562 [Coemansia sp. BCRC 34962]|nr:hypothetical protein IW152_003562 [Coemansia sp. BCRC 34962]
MEFSQRPAHSSTHSGVHGFMAAAPPPAHRIYAVPDSQQQQQQTFYATSPYMHHQQQQHTAADVYPPASRRLPSVSELLVSQSAAQQQAVAGHLARDSAPYAASYSPASIQQKSFGIDVPQARSSAHHHRPSDYAAIGHRDSESASSVSSQTTLLGGYSPPLHQRAFVPDHKGDQDEVYTAASILMSLRACKMPC